MGNLVESIVAKIKTQYNGKLDCEEQRADLFVYVNGNEETIKAIDTEKIYFDDFEVELNEADIHSLAYIDEVI